ncbi:MAG: hypothetical protein WCE54_11675 [Ignavibacteriaceae bacterium]
MFFYGKVKVNMDMLSEFGQKLSNNELNRSHVRAAFCLKENPEIGLNIWEAESRAELEKILITYKPYFSQVIEIKELITPQESFAFLIQEIQV